MTIVTESFNKADSTTLGPDLVWTEVQGDMQVVSNTARAVAGDIAVHNFARAETDLATDNNYAQIVLSSQTTASGLRKGVCARYSSAANTNYLARWGNGTSQTAHNICKVVSGTLTVLSSQFSVGMGTGETGKIVCNGSTISSYRIQVTGERGPVIHSLTDTSITSGRRGGFYINTNGAANLVLDNFEAGDYTPLPTELSNSFEGGSDEVEITTANSGGASGNAFHYVTAGGYNYFDTAQKVNGSLSGRCGAEAQNSAYVAWYVENTQTFNISGWFRIDALPTSPYLVPGGIIAFVPFSGNGDEVRVGVKEDGRIDVGFISGGVWNSVILCDTALAVDTWYKIEVSQDLSSERFQIRIFDSAGSPLELKDGGIVTPNVSNIQLGVAGQWDSSQSSVVWLDDLSVDSDNSLFPLLPDAGPDQFVDEASTVTLDATGSEAGVTSYLWEQVAGPTVTLSSTTAAQPTFTAPYVDS